MNRIIAERWMQEDRELLGIDCIVYASGKVTVLKSSSFYNTETKKRRYSCIPLCDTTIESIIYYCNDPWTHVDEWVSINYQNGRIIGGDGAMGHDGFIACTDAEDNLLWSIFLDLNPIKLLKIKENTLIAINEHDEIKIEIDLNNLTDITITVIREYL